MCQFLWVREPAGEQFLEGFLTLATLLAQHTQYMTALTAQHTLASALTQLLSVSPASSRLLPSTLAHARTSTLAHDTTRASDKRPHHTTTFHLSNQVDTLDTEGGIKNATCPSGLYKTNGWGRPEVSSGIRLAVISFFGSIAVYGSPFQFDRLTILPRCTQYLVQCLCWMVGWKGRKKPEPNCWAIIISTVDKSHLGIVTMERSASAHSLAVPGTRTSAAKPGKN